MATESQIQKEIDLVQDVIKRMASNSFEVKKWLIGIFTIILVFKHDELLGGNLQLIWLLLIPVLCFWYLDSFFLSTEKLYREIYIWNLENRSSTFDEYLYDLNTFVRKNSKGGTDNLILEANNIWNVSISSTIWPFYFLPTIFIFIYGIIYNIHYCCCCCHHF